MTTDPPPPLFELEPLGTARSVRSSDVLSADGRYRYRLDREWAPDLGRVCWIMLNPSTARRDVTDRTDTRVHGFTRSWGYGAYSIVNLHGWCATDPAELATAADPIGPANAEHLAAAIAGAALTVAAWGGSYPARSRPIVRRATRVLRPGGVHVLGLTASGDPRHPLFMLGAARPMPWHELAGDHRQVHTTGGEARPSP